MKWTPAILLSVWLIGCVQTNESVEQVSLSVQNLPPLKGGYYEVWVTVFQFNKPAGAESPLHEGEYKSAGAFNVAEDGTLRNPSGGAARLKLPSGTNTQLLKDIVVSVQTRNTGQPQSILMGGAFRGDATSATADLSIGYADAFRTNFSSATGSCTIVAPTSPPDSNSGVWFVELGSSITPGLRNLPVLSSGWRYEGWVVQSASAGGFTFISTGKFSRADSADLDGAGPYAGTAGQPFNFPGQDFVRGMVIPNLLSGGYGFLVSVEPFPDNAPEPFFLTLLASSPGASQSRVQVFTNVIASRSPKGRIVVRR